MMIRDFATMAPPLVALMAGVVSAALYGRKRRWPDALLAGAAGVALAVTIADVRLPVVAAGALAVNTDAGRLSDAERAAIPGASGIALSGDGLREAEWRDLPARPLAWKPAAADLMWLDFPRSMSLGRIFMLTVRRSQPHGAWRLQLLAENKQVLADSGASAASQLSVQWLPPVAEAMVLQARLLDTAGKVIAQGPVPLQVKDAVPLQIQGRFDAPSFDAKVLNQLLAGGGAMLDWSVTLGKLITRSETAREPLTAPNALFVDAAYVEHLGVSARTALLAQAAKGMPLVVLGANATDAAMWQRDFGLRLQPQSPTTEKEDVRQFGGGLALPPAGLNPAEGSWTVLARDAKRQPWMWQRGHVVWIGVADWHKYAISAPQALALWWQSALDLIALESEQKTAWQMSDPMPLPGLRTEVCAQGVKPGTALTIAGSVAPAGNDAQAGPALQSRADKADGVCAAFWPQHAGWVTFDAAGMRQQGREYVYAANDWPAWQKALRRDATAIYATRSMPVAGAGGSADAGRSAVTTFALGGSDGGRRLPVAPFGGAFALCMLALWWREQRAAGSVPAPASTPIEA